MRSTFKLLYFVKRNAVKKNGNAPIIARITIDQVVAQFNTKLEINPAHWSVELGKASGRTAEAVHINSMLESIRSTVHQHYHALMAQDGYVTAELVLPSHLIRYFYAPPMRTTKLFWFSNSRAKEGLIFQVSQYS